MSRIQSSFDTTYCIQSLSPAQPEYSPSLFSTHLLHPKTYVVRDYSHYPADWITGILIFCFILIAWTQVFYFKRVKQIFQAIFSKRFVNQLVRDGNLFNERVSIAYSMVYVLAFSLFLYQCNDRIIGFFPAGLHGFLLYAIFTAGVFLFWTGKMFAVQLLGTVFKTRETTYNYLLNYLVFCLITGPVILIFLVFIIYLKSHFLLIFCSVLLGFFFAFRVVRGFLIGITLHKFSYLFLFVYLCSLEILPLLFMIKLVLVFTHSASL
ncbi:MAG: DUF4271 domain-containing protein [Bacteroidales bacterium]|nr:DUF4271 domain-containing protein [Bacteroidales bacterium]MDD4602229.1 DUF4271 domain-containing protein [Bacteroidales bacterium]